MAKPSRMSAGKEESSAFTYDTLVYPWNSPIPIVTVEGDSTEMGKQFGSATKETIQKIVSFNMPTLEKILEKAQIKKKDYLKNAESVLEKFGMSSYLDEIESMSEAAGVPYQSLLLVNTNIDILYNLPTPQNHGPLFCSYFAAWGNATKNGSTVAGHNDDGGRIMDQFLVLKVAKPKEGHPFVCPTVPGYIGYHSMVNSTQTYMCSTGIDDIIKNSEARDDGIPSWFLFRYLGQFSSSGKDAIKRFLSVPNETCINWCFTSASDGATIVESTPKHHEIAKYPTPKHDWIVSAGKTLCPSMYKFFARSEHPTCGDYRYNSIKKIVSEKYSKIDSDVGIAIMSNHYDSKSSSISPSENTVCRHMEFSGKFAGTCRSLVVEFSKNESGEPQTEINVSLGNPCYGYWRRLHLDSKFETLDGLNARKHAV